MERMRTLLSVLVLAALAAPGPAAALEPFPIALPESSAPAQTPSIGHGSQGRIDRVVVRKAERRLYLMHGDESIRAYEIALGFRPNGHKRRQGDGKTPEGRYRIDYKHPGSSYHKALHISYPGLGDRLRAVIRGQDPGGDIMIHGQPNGARTDREGDWTLGCIAVTNSAIDEIYDAVAVGTRVEILP